MNVKVLLLLLWLPSAALAQGFAGLGRDAGEFAEPQRGTALRFPQDHLAHPMYRIEWWYVTATLSGADGRDYGVQWTLFRSALRPEDDADTHQIWMGHAGLTTSDQHYAAERRARSGLGVAGVEPAPFHAFIDDWSMRSTAHSGDPLDELTLTARMPQVSYDLTLTATGPLVLHGDAGYSQKSPAGQASYYYSQPFYTVTGTLDLPQETVAVTGNAWLDREWSFQPLADDQTGWDWFSLQFQDGARLMGFGLRSRNGGHFTSATWIQPDGTPIPYGNGALVLTPLEQTEVAGRTVPTVWRVQLAAKGLDITTQPLNSNSWMNTSFPYWEGPIRFEGSHAGRGYLEMTGYD